MNSLLTATTLRTWVRRAAADAGELQDVLTTEERQELSRLRRENKQLRQEREIPKSCGHPLRQGERARVALIAERQVAFPIAVLFRVLDVSRSGFYDDLTHPVTEREVRDMALAAKARAVFVEHKGRYGSPRVWRELCERGDAGERDEGRPGHA